MWVNTSNPWLRAFAIAISVAMCWAIFASANHFWVDMAIGGAIVALSWYLAKWGEQYLRRRRLARAASQEPAG